MFTELIFQLGEVGATEDLRVHIAVAVQPQEHLRAFFEAALLLRAVEPLLYVLSKSFVQHRFQDLLCYRLTGCGVDDALFRNDFALIVRSGAGVGCFDVKRGAEIAGNAFAAVLLWLCIG